MHWGAYITDARTRTGLTIAELAERAGLPAGLISDWEYERDCPRVDEWVQLLAAAGFVPEVRLSGDDGVDIAQIQRHLAMSPDERLDFLIAAANWALQGRRALATAHEAS